VTAVCGADKTGPPKTPTKATKRRSVEQRTEPAERRRRSDGSLRSPSDQRRVGRRASDTTDTDRLAELEFPLPPSPLPSNDEARDNTPEFENDNNRSAAAPVGHAILGGPCINFVWVPLLSFFLKLYIDHCR